MIVVVYSMGQGWGIIIDHSRRVRTLVAVSNCDQQHYSFRHKRLPCTQPEPTAPTDFRV